MVVRDVANVRVLSSILAICFFLIPPAFGAEEWRPAEPVIDIFIPNKMHSLKPGFLGEIDSYLYMNHSYKHNTLNKVYKNTLRIQNNYIKLKYPVYTWLRGCYLFHHRFLKYDPSKISPYTYPLDPNIISQLSANINACIVGESLGLDYRSYQILAYQQLDLFKNMCDKEPAITSRWIHKNFEEFRDLHNILEKELKTVKTIK